MQYNCLCIRIALKSVCFAQRLGAIILLTIMIYNIINITDRKKNKCALNTND